MNSGNLFGNDPAAFFGTAAGPRLTDYAGPPSGVLDVYLDGTPMAQSQADASSVASGGGRLAFLARPDVQAFGLLILGAIMVHLATK